MAGRSTHSLHTTTAYAVICLSGAAVEKATGEELKDLQGYER